MIFFGNTLHSVVHSVVHGGSVLCEPGKAVARVAIELNNLRECLGGGFFASVSCMRTTIVKAFVPPFLMFAIILSTGTLLRWRLPNQIPVNIGVALFLHLLCKLGHKTLAIIRAYGVG